MAELLPGLNINRLAPPIHLSVVEYNELLVTHGSSAEWRKAVLCPCVRIDTRQPRGNCDHCRGRGYLYPEDLRKPLLILDTSRTAAIRAAAAGLMAEGQVTVTFPCGHIPGQYDLLLMDGEHHVVAERLYREETRRLDDVTHLRPDRADYSGARPKAQLPRRERLVYSDDICIEAVYWEDADRNLLYARQGADFTLGPSNEWIWHEGTGPEPGAAWTVRYRATAAYLVQGSGPLLRRENSANMPYRVVAQRLDRIGPEDLR